MMDNQERTFIPTEAPPAESTPRAEATPPEEHNGIHGANGSWHAEAGRKGARRIHQLIKEGKLYEQEHGLKSGRQRLRQLIELGKLYEQEHGLGPQKKRRKRLSGVERQEVLVSLLQCLLRMVKPSFRPELVRLVEALQEVEKGHAA